MVSDKCTEPHPGFCPPPPPRSDLTLAPPLPLPPSPPSSSQWPSLLRTLSPALLDLPPMVQDKYRACQAMCFCGLFPSIGRAWASVDNSLFLWRYDRRFGSICVDLC